MISICDDLRKSVLQAAIQGRLSQQLPEDGNAEDLYKEIQTEKQKLIKEGKINKEKPLPEISEDDIPFDIPANWKWVRLSELLIVQPSNGFSPKSITKKTPYKKLTLTATTSGIFKDSWNYVDITDAQAKKYYLKANDLLIQRSNSREFVGTVCIYPGPDDLYIFPDLMMRMKSIDNVDLIYLYIVLRAPITKAYYSEKASGTSESMPKINQEIVKMTLIPLPPFAEQKRIVARVDELMARIDEMEKTEKDITTLYEAFPGDMKASLLQAAIQGKLTEQLASDGDAETLYQDIQKEKQRLIKEGKIKKEKPLPAITEDDIPFDIPENWKWVRFANVYELVSGRDLAPNEYNSSNKGIPYITGASQFENEQLLITRWTEAPSVISHKGDFLLTCKGTIGSTAFNDIGDLHIARQVMAVRSQHPILLQYFKICFDSFINEIKAKAKSMIPGIDRTTVLSMLIPLPPLAEQKRIVEKLDQLLPLCDSMKEAIDA